MTPDRFGPPSEEDRIRIVQTGAEQATVCLTGPIDPYTARQVGRALHRVIADGYAEVVVDVGQAIDVDVRLLTALADASEQIKLTVVGVRVPEFLPALHKAKLDEAWVVYNAVRQSA